MSNLPLQPGQFFVDEFRSGYPKYVALLSTHTSFHNFRAFKRLRLRLLLAKQDEISVLEKQLDEIDAAENRDLFLGCMRRDANVDRQSTLLKIKLSMSEYDDMIAQYRGTTSLPNASGREVQNLQNWIDATSSLDRSESSYLQHKYDLVNIASSGDTSTAYTEAAVEECVYWIEVLLARVFPGVRIGRLRVTRDDDILLLSPLLQKICRAITITMVTLIILAPTIVLLSIASPVGRIIASIISGAFFLSIISFLTQAKTIEVFAAGASYAAVLVVFTAPR